jgi:hypothetical protein
MKSGEINLLVVINVHAILCRIDGWLRYVMVS